MCQTTNYTINKLYSVKYEIGTGQRPVFVCNGRAGAPTTSHRWPANPHYGTKPQPCTQLDCPVPISY